MKYSHVFLLGRPGCGKSALYSELEGQLLESGRAGTIERVDDFPKVWGRLKGDDVLEKAGKERLYSERSSEGAYLITDDQFFDDILKEVNSDLLSIDKPDHTVFVEFARPNYVEAIQIFDERILDRCFVIYMEVNFELCWTRNLARYEASGTQEGDDHMVYRETMEELYLHDDQDAFVQYLRGRDIPVMVVNNEADGEEQLKRQAKVLLADLF